MIAHSSGDTTNQAIRKGSPRAIRYRARVKRQASPHSFGVFSFRPKNSISILILLFPAALVGAPAAKDSSGGLKVMSSAQPSQAK